MRVGSTLNTRWRCVPGALVGCDKNTMEGRRHRIKSTAVNVAEIARYCHAVCPSHTLLPQVSKYALKRVVSCTPEGCQGVEKTLLRPPLSATSSSSCPTLPLIREPITEGFPGFPRPPYVNKSRKRVVEGGAGMRNEVMCWFPIKVGLGKRAQNERRNNNVRGEKFYEKKVRQVRKQHASFLLCTRYYLLAALHTFKE